MMKFLSTVFALLLIIIPGSSFFLVYNLFRKKENGRGNKTLGTVVFFLGLEVISVFTRGTTVGAYLYEHIWTPLHFLWLPLFYFYLRFLLDEETSFAQIDLAHGLPAALLLISLIGQSLHVFRLGEGVQNMVVSALLQMQIFVYLALILSKLNKARKKENTETEHGRVRWGCSLLYLCTASCILIGLDAYTGRDFYFFFLLSLCVSLLYLEFGFISNPSLFSIFTMENAEQGEKYRNTKLTDQTLNLYAEKIEKAMRNEKLYTQPDLSIEKLSAHLDLPEHEVSQVINSSFRMNFFNFVNSYRLEYAMELLRNSSEHKKTMLEIAFESGFNSKSTFYTYFKKATGSTPRRILTRNSSNK